MARQRHFTDYDGAAKYAAVGTVGLTGWKLGVTEAVQTVRRQIILNLVSNVLLSVVLLAVTVVLLAVMIRKKLSPLTQVGEDLERLSMGDFSVKVEKGTREDEIGVLQGAAAQLVDTLSDLVREMNRVLGRIADYDLTVSGIRSYPGDFDQMSKSVNAIKAMLQELLTQVQSASAEVSSGADQVSDSAQALAQSASQQTDSAQQLASEAAEIAENITRTAQYAQTAQEGTNSTYANIRQCSGHMDDLMKAMAVIDEKSGEVSKVIKAIEDIAFQTNILALNAAVEAARAGAAGKGFAVVADEVRSLANKSAQAAQSTTVLIQETLNAVANGTALSRETEQSLNKVVEEAQAILDSVTKISAATTEQARSVQQVTESIGVISGSVQNSAASAEESAGASEEMSGQAALLKQLVGQFKLGGSL